MRAPKVLGAVLTAILVAALSSNAACSGDAVDVGDGSGSHSGPQTGFLGPGPGVGGGGGGVGGSGIATDLTIWATGTTLGNYAGSSPSACSAGQAMTGVAISAAGVITPTCSASVSSIVAGTDITQSTTNGAATVNVDETLAQHRVSGTCTSPNAIRTVAQDGTVTCTTGVVDTAGTGLSKSGSTLNSTATFAIFGTGTDGTVTFDGTTTILGLAPSSNVYTMTRAIWCHNCTINTGVEIKTAGFGFFDDGTLTLNGTAKITDNGANASGSTNGGTRAAGWYGATNPGGAGGGNAGSASTTSLCNPFITTTSGGSAGAIGGTGGLGGSCVGGGGGGASATNTGGAGGALTAPGAGNCGNLILQLQNGKNAPSLGTTLTFGTGGGGGGTNGGAGGGGGASGGLVFVAAKIFAGSGTVEAKGGNGGNAASGGGGGGGGGGGFAVMVYETNSGTVTTVITGGTHGTGAGGGGNGGDGGNCLSFKFNLSGDGT